ncbi:MAG: hypothetical protein GXX83_02150 [Gaiellales bacterium]|nr:hypothetical protein [Gaiellales bacterium]
MKGAPSQCGWALLEVSASLALLSILLAGMLQVWVSLAGRVQRTEELLGQVVVTPDDALVGRRAAWGVCVEKAEWKEGPALEVATSPTLPEEGVQVGLWVQGWFLGEYPVANGDVVLADPFLRQARQGEEAVVRARGAGGGWGPPRRLLVPGDAGAETESLSTILVHAPSFAHTEVEVVTSRGRVQVAADGCVHLEAVGGTVEVRLGSLAQAFRAEEGRCLDLFF